MTVAAVLLVVGSRLPPGLRQLTLAALVIIGGSAILFLVLWVGEQVVARYDSPRSLAIGSMILTSVSAMVIILVLLPLPGGRGPVQYSVGNAAAMFVFHLRVATILALLFSPLMCGLTGKVRLDLERPFRLGWLIAAITSYAVAWYAVSFEFFPTV